MNDFDPIQYVQDGMDITSSPYAEQDATEIRAWTETGDLITAVELNATTGDWEITEGPGQDVGTVVGADLANPRDAALDFVRNSVPSADYLSMLTWESAGTDEPGDQNADTSLVEHGYWSLGPAYQAPGVDGERWSVELVEQNEDLEEIGGVSLGIFATEADAKAAAQAHEARRCTDCGCEALA